MNTVLIDTSVWIHFFRSKTLDKVCKKLELLLDENKAAICGIVEMELLHGLRSSEQTRISSLLSALIFLESHRDIYRIAGKSLCALRKKGITIPSSDSIIAATAAYYRVPIFTLDHHFDHFPVKQF